MLSKWSVRSMNGLLLAMTLVRYKRRELGQRTAMICYGQSLHDATFTAPNIGSIGFIFGNALGPLLASAILDGMDEVIGQAGWR